MSNAFRKTWQSPDRCTISPSKKDPAKRAEEHLNAISDGLIKYATENMHEIVQNTFAILVMCETMLCVVNVDKAQPLEKLASFAKGEASDHDKHVMTSFANRTLKILVNGRHRLPQHLPQQTRVDLHFGSMLLPHIQDRILAYATHTTASFVVLALLESPETRDEVCRLLMPHTEKLKEHMNELGVQHILKELKIEVTSNRTSNKTKVSTRKR
jgi:hypothetical protein